MAAQMNSDATFFRNRQDFLPIMTSVGVLRDFVVFNGSQMHLEIRRDFFLQPVFVEEQVKEAFTNGELG